MTGRAINPAYSDTGALAVVCMHCGAKPGDPCTKSDGRISRVPCVDRLSAADLAPAHVPGVERDPKSRSNAHPIDYSEPRHPPEQR